MGCCASTASELPELTPQKYRRGEYVDESLAFQDVHSLALQENLMTWSGDDFKVRDSDGNITLKISGKAISWHTTMAIMNLRNMPLLTIKADTKDKRVLNVMKIVDLDHSQGDFKGLRGFRRGAGRLQRNSVSSLSRTDSTSTFSTENSTADTSEISNTTDTSSVTSDTNDDTSVDDSYFEDDGGHHPKAGGDRSPHELLFSITPTGNKQGSLATIRDADGTVVYDVIGRARSARSVTYSIQTVSGNDAVCLVAPKLFTWDNLYTGFHVQMAPYTDVAVMTAFVIALDHLLPSHG